MQLISIKILNLNNCFINPSLKAQNLDCFFNNIIFQMLTMDILELGLKGLGMAV